MGNYGYKWLGYGMTIHNPQGDQASELYDQLGHRTQSTTFELNTSRIQTKGLPKMKKFNNTTINRNPVTGSIIVTLHSTQIVTVSPDGVVKLNSGGYQSVTTKTRMNQIGQHFDLGYRVVQLDGVWFVEKTFDKETVKFQDGMEL